jgi:ABC-type multidrug transport system fused ATPase/permease subunit
MNCVSTTRPRHLAATNRKDRSVPLANFSFGDALLLVVEIFFFVIWIWILFTIIGDLFRDHEMSGWAKAVWIIVLVFIPFLGALIYLIARGSGMRERALKAQAEAKHHMDAYIQQQAHSSPADELHKLSDLKDKGAISAEEFEKAKAKLLA